MYRQFWCANLLHPRLFGSGWRNNARLSGFTTRCANLKTTLPPVMTAASLLRLTGDITGHGCSITLLRHRQRPERAWLQLGHSKRCWKGVKRRFARNRSVINKWVSERGLFVRQQAGYRPLPEATGTQYSRNFSPQRSQIRCRTWVA